MDLNVSNPPRIGIVGGGQLGKMLAMDAKRLGLKVNILDPSYDCPASSIADEHIVAGFNDRQGIMRLAEMSHVLTYEIELVDADVLKELEDKGYKVRHPSYVVKVTQDKYMQKFILSKHGIPTARFMLIDGNLSDVSSLGYPLVIKVRKGGYDGRGNIVIRSKEDLESLRLKEFIRRYSSKDNIGFYAEEYVNFVKEISVIVARAYDGSSVAYPVAENIHDDGILDTSIVPARIDEHTYNKAREIARDVIDAFNGIGVFGVEMFLTSDGSIMVNEIAPRVHNSGHYTIEACNVSQFEEHIRAIMDMPLVEPRMICNSAVMVNILGNDAVNGKYALSNIDALLSIDGLRLHIYGKSTNKGRRKLGHMTILSNSREDAIAKAMYARSLLKIISVDGN
jgi:5-(carboxyamino)imidazole ribonucleotide synthase